MAVVQYKTPGVYVQELDAFPPSIVGVETAVPVFIGYTAKADRNGRSVLKWPVRITSMADYAPIFGGAFDYQFTFNARPPVITQKDVDEAKARVEEKRTANETAKTTNTPIVNDPNAAKPAKEAAQQALTEAEAAFQKASQDAVNLENAYKNSDYYGPEQAALAAEDKSSKLAKDDAKKDTQEAKDAAAEAKKARDAANAVRDRVPNVSVGGAGYELAVVKNFYLYNCLRLFYANGGGNCYIVSVGSYADTPGFQALKDGLDAVRDLVGPTMLVIPEAVALDSKDSYDKLVPEMLQQCSEKQDRVAILDVWGTATAKDQAAFRQTIDDFRSHSVAGSSLRLKYGMAYAPFLNTSIVDPTEVSFTNLDDAGKATLKAVIEKEVDRLFPGPKAKELKEAFANQLTDVKNETDPDEQKRKFRQLNQNMTAQVAALKDIYGVMARTLGTLPPSAAMAGVYTQNDTLRGVWNAPANVGLVAVTAPTVAINNDMQDDLNMPIGGLAINAIRDFVGRGTLVWGARTLDGNSNDWRYIQVRRALIYIEQSVELALNKFVFEPNVAQTWVTVTSMIGGFLRGVWQAGGLMGASPAEAFSIQCGLGTTMTAQDVLEGRMIVQIKLQMVHPAEFIVLTFQQQMQGGAG